MHFILKSIPLLLTCGVILFPLCLWSLASSLGHINPIFPYVSDLGIVPPEASLFTLCMCTGSGFIAMFVLLRYDLNRSFVAQSTFVTIYDQTNSDSVSERNIKDPEAERALLKQAKASLASGLCMSLGFILVGCFRNNETDLVQVLHNVFALVAFSCALIDIYLELRTAHLVGLDRTSRHRSIILSLCLVFLVVYSTNGVASFVTNPKSFIEKDARLMWSSHQAGYLLHVISTSVEWMLIYTLSAYFYTFHSMFVRASYLKANTNSQPTP